MQHGKTVDVRPQKLCVIVGAKQRTYKRRRRDRPSRTGLLLRTSYLLGKRVLFYHGKKPRLMGTF